MPPRKVILLTCFDETFGLWVKRLKLCLWFGLHCFWVTVAWLGVLVSGEFYESCMGINFLQLLLLILSCLINMERFKLISLNAKTSLVMLDHGREAEKGGSNNWGYIFFKFLLIRTVISEIVDLDSRMLLKLFFPLLRIDI